MLRRLAVAVALTGAVATYAPTVLASGVTPAPQVPQQKSGHKCVTHYRFVQYRRFVERHLRHGKFLHADERRFIVVLDRCLPGPRARKRAHAFFARYWAQQMDPCPADVIACIREAAAKYNQPFADALRVAKCESSLNPGPSSAYAGHLGLYQFLQSTFDSTIYRGKDIWSAKWNALAAMWMWSVGRRGEWQCQ